MTNMLNRPPTADQQPPDIAQLQYAVAHEAWQQLLPVADLKDQPIQANEKKNADVIGQARAIGGQLATSEAMRTSVAASPAADQIRLQERVIDEELKAAHNSGDGTKIAEAQSRHSIYESNRRYILSQVLGIDTSA